MNREPDWNFWRSFAAVVEHGSLSGAARALSISQPTIGRHIEALELALALKLFDRTLSGLKPNATALRLYEPIRTAQAAIAEANIRATGAQDTLLGTVRITASLIISHHVLPAILAPLRLAYPNIALEIIPSDTSENLLLNDADIALRMFRPTQLELISRHLGSTEIVALAHETYLARRGTPRTLDELFQHDLIGFSGSTALISHAKTLGYTLTDDNFAIRSADQAYLWEAIKAGLGIGFGQKVLAQTTSGLVVLPIDIKAPPLPFWLTTHEHLFTSPRIRAIYDALANGITAYIRGEPKTPSIG
ncbi:LysR family transcriptional regulator [Devosia sp. MC532]|uniref:LysR family transcriptional regulator n=1 Tax=Devosia sp. MC532 TaxID=2799788 RepID=UPI0018F690AA|nr:LysR family transcriptional regulator [Devosia sp. MC532]MBJ7578679.1 LysR family transcriptional regulator [Devosia sp. MC532]